MKYIKSFNEGLYTPEKSYAEELEMAKSFPLGAGDHLVCVFSDHFDFEYGKLYEIKEISTAKLTLAVYGNSGKRWFFHNDVENESVNKVFRNNETDQIATVLLFPGTLEHYLDKKEAEKYNL